LFTIFILWWDWIVVRNDVSPLLIPAPGVVWDALIFVVQQPHVQRHTYITLYETLVGFSFAAVFGITAGVALGKVRFLERLFSPFIVATQVVPKVAVVPLFVLWFGFGVQSKIFMAALLSFFPILQNTILGVRSIDRGHRDLMLVVQASRLKRIVSLDVPSSLPYVLTGIELGMVFALTGAVVGEYLGGSEGLGAFVIITLGALKTDQLFAAVVLLTVLGFMLYAVVAGIRRFVIPWHESSGLVRDA
jgi:NitT/TauT family transport system permease protein